MDIHSTIYSLYTLIYVVLTAHGHKPAPPFLCIARTKFNRFRPKWIQNCYNGAMSFKYLKVIYLLI